MLSHTISTSAAATKKLGKAFAKELCVAGGGEHATVIALKGELGSGKTTFVQGIAQGLGIKERIVSPTFVIMKRFALPKHDFSSFVHIDCYRLQKAKELEELGIRTVLADSTTIVAIEWPEVVTKLLPKDTVRLEFAFVDEKTRKINT